MNSSEGGDSIEEINLNRNIVFGNKDNPYNTELMQGVIINVRSGKNAGDSGSALVSMLEKRLSQISADEKRRRLRRQKAFYARRHSRDSNISKAK